MKAEIFPTISVIVPVYNTERYLAQCIESILAQTFTDIELVLVNDGSTDNSGKICDDYSAKDKRIRVFHKKNGGVSSARNLGITKARGEWISFVDSDDWIEPDFLQSFVKYMSDKVDLIIQGMRYCRFNINGMVSTQSPAYGINKIVNKKECSATLFDIRPYMLHILFTKLFRNFIIQHNNIRFDPDMNFGEDQVFILEYLPYIRYAGFCNCWNYNYRLMGEQNTLSSRRREFEDIIFQIDKNYKALYDFWLKEKYEFVLSFCSNYYYTRTLINVIIPLYKFSTPTCKRKKVLYQLKRKYKDKNLKISNIEKLIIKLFFIFFSIFPTFLNDITARLVSYLYDYYQRKK